MSVAYAFGKMTFGTLAHILVLVQKILQITVISTKVEDRYALCSTRTTGVTKPNRIGKQRWKSLALPNACAR